MTQDETNKIMGDTAAELVDVRRRLGCLGAKAEGMIASLTQGVAVLRDGLGTGDGEVELPSANGWPSLGQVEKLRDDLNETRTRRHKLTERLREWGVIK